MEKVHFLNAIKSLRETSTKRKFEQTFDIVVNLKGLDLKKEATNLKRKITTSNYLKWSESKRGMMK